MKKLLKDSEIYSILGLLGTTIFMPSEKFSLNWILGPIFLLMLVIGAICTVKKLLKEK